MRADRRGVFGWNAWVAAAALSGCVATGVDDGYDVQQDDELAAEVIGESSQALTVDAPLSSADAGQQWRWIGRKKDWSTPCPVASGNLFETRHLFSPTSQDVSPSALPPALRQFCLYTAPSWSTIPSGMPSVIRDLLRSNRKDALAVVERDIQAVTPFATASATALRSTVGPEFNQQFAVQSGRVSKFPLAGGSSNIRDADRPRLAVLDTIPTYTPAQEPWRRYSRSPHGYGLANMALDSTQDQLGERVARVSSQLALPLRTYKSYIIEDNYRGGFFGSVGWLAESVRKEVYASQVEARRFKGDLKLILNLSLGWSPDYGGNSGSLYSWPVAVQAAFWALLDAHCNGALIVSAAGNKTGGPSGNKGPVLPAAWERYGAPGARFCEWALGRDAAGSVHSGSGNYKPFLYSVSAVDYKGDTLGVSRDSGQSRIAAFGDHGVTTDDLGKETQALTGTSVSTTVVASAAAAVWFYVPDVTPYEVMDIVFDSGNALGVAPDYCHSSAGAGCGGSTARVSVCQAAAKACSSGHYSPWCPAGGFGCDPWKKAPAHMSALDYSGFSAGANHYVMEYDTLTANDPACGSTDLAIPAGATTPGECPEAQYYGDHAKPWTLPQPESDPCPNCLALIGDSALFLSNPSDFTTYTDSTLGVTDVHGNTTNYPLGSLSGTDVSVEMDPSILSGASRVTYTGTADGSSHTSSLYLGW